MSIDSEYLEKNYIPILAIVAFIILIFLVKKNKEDGYINGVFDAEPDMPSSEGGKSENNNPVPNNLGSEIYADNPIRLQYFTIKEFESKDKEGSGVNMRVSTLEMLDKARAKAGIPFVINSGYRTVEHNKKVKGVSNSSHLQGWAADISVTQEGKRNIILKALYDVGFKRFGVANTFIHVDNDPTKNGDAIWNYDGFKITYNPLSERA